MMEMRMVAISSKIMVKPFAKRKKPYSLHPSTTSYRNVIRLAANKSEVRIALSRSEAAM